MTDTEEARWLALCAAVRALAMHAARVANPKRPGDWFESVMAGAHGLVADMTHPDRTPEQQEEMAEAAEETLRLIFDDAMFQVRTD